MNKLTPFQIAILGIFGLFLVFAVLVFAGIIPLFKNAPQGVGGEVTMWGTFSGDLLREPIDELNREANGLFTVSYIEKFPETLDFELVEALASGVGPDVLLLPHDLVLRHRDKVFPIPYESFSVRQFLDTFIEEGELYLSQQGILALPFSIDPLVMYWNRDLFSAAGIAKPPVFWDEFFTLALELTKTDASLNILQSTVALGEFDNITHAKELLALLFMQAGSPIVSLREGKLYASLGGTQEGGTPPAESALRFFTEFSNSAKTVYSWNRSLPHSKDLFLAGDLALYFGFASELSDIRAKSPHLNFDIAIMPQIRDAAKMTYGNMTGFSVLRQSDNPQTAFHVISLLSGVDFLKTMSERSNIPPVRRDLLKNPPPGASQSIFYSSALIAKAWLDPHPRQTEAIFNRLVNNVVSGRERLSEAVNRASTDVGRLLPQ